MGTLDRIKELKQLGYGESDIIQVLQEEGASPRDINDSLAKAQIKESISSYPEYQQSYNSQFSAEQNQLSEDGMEPSLMNQVPTPMPQNGAYSREAYSEEMPSQQQGFQDQGYTNNSSTEMMTEIADQVVSEKISKLMKALNSIIEFKTLMDAKVERIDSRLERVEKIIDQLQTSLIRKSFDQEENIQDIKTELRGMQEGFSKVLPSLASHTGHHKSSSKHKTTSKKKK